MIENIFDWKLCWWTIGLLLDYSLCEFGVFPGNNKKLFSFLDFVSFVVYTKYSNFSLRKILNIKKVFIAYLILDNETENILLRWNRSELVKGILRASKNMKKKKTYLSTVLKLCLFQLSWIRFPFLVSNFLLGDLCDLWSGKDLIYEVCW